MQATSSWLREHGDQAAVYREAPDLFGYEQAPGFDTGWVRSYKFRRRGSVPSFGCQLSWRAPYDPQ